MGSKRHSLRLKQLGINTYKESVVYMHAGCHICHAEGFEAPARIEVTLNERKILATLHSIETNILQADEAGLSTYAWEVLNAKEGDKIYLAHPKPLDSFSYVLSKIYGHDLQKEELTQIIQDIVAGYLSDLQIAVFLTACASGHLNKSETLYLTKAMISAGDTVQWSSEIIVDKHCVGGLPGNRTTLIVVPIVAAFGLTIPNTSSRAITSPAGTADTMEVLAPVSLDISAMRQVVEQENACLVWGGAVTLSPADDILVRIEHVLDLDSEGQLVASILSKKRAAGVTHLLVDIPIGLTAKVRTQSMAMLLKNYLESIGKELGMHVHTIFTDGTQPIGRGIGPALEARDIIAVLQGDLNAPQDLRERSLILAGQILEFSPDVKLGTGKQLATQLLDSGRAWQKFQAISKAQGGMFKLPTAAYTHIVTATRSGKVVAIDSRKLARVAKLAGAPVSKAAGVEWLAPLGTMITKDQPLFVIYSETHGELKYARSYLEQEHDIIKLEEK